MDTSKPGILQVAINAPLSRLFDYLPPESTNGCLQPGARVSVPFGRQNQTGIIIQLAEKSDLPRERLKRATATLDESPLLAADELWLIRFASDYYHHPIGEVVAAALPAALRKGQALSDYVQQIALGSAAADVDLTVLRKRAPKQAEVLEALSAEPLGPEELDERVDGWRRTRKRLLENNWIQINSIKQQAGPAAIVTMAAGPELNADQATAVAALRAGSGFRVSLLDGVTGSGKTEVYLRLMADVLQAGKQVLIVVPEIGLTPQLVSRLAARLGHEPAVLHSGLTDTARLTAWRQARTGKARVILGTRSAIFVPLSAPGLIIVDEEHDNSLKQQEGFRYSARDLAIARGKRLDIPVILGTATPSLETLKHCNDGTYEHLLLPARAAAVAPPLMRLIDLNIHGTDDGISEAAITAIKQNIDAGGQVLVFLNRRGFAPTLICGGCGHIAECDRCDARMTVHAAANELRCHHCGACRRMDVECSECGSRYRALGHGTERLEDSMLKRFPDLAIARVDSDSTRLKGTMDEALSRATTGETRILIGTQMLSKGHHFPNLTLVVVVNADQGLFSTDFRASEKLAQSLVQVAGRAGREKRQGEVLIQTAFPANPFWGELFRGGYESVARSALEERGRTAWPPYSRLAMLRASAHERNDAQRFLEQARAMLEQVAGPDMRLLGPVSAPMERRAGRYRAQLLLQSVNRQALHALLHQLRHHLETSKSSRKVRWSIDVDPIELF